MSNQHKTRVLFVGNSQSTSAGLNDQSRWANYPSLVQTHFTQLECHYWLMSSLSVATIDNQFDEIITQHQPDIVILHPGIIEGSLRILPTKLKDLLRVLPGGRFITGTLHKRRRGWYIFLSKLNIQFFEVNINDYQKHLRNIADRCGHLNYKLIFMTVAPLSESHERRFVPGNNEILVKYNLVLSAVARDYNVPIINTFANNLDPTNRSLYLEEGGVHFSVAGHKLIAKNIINFMDQHIRI